MNQEYKTTTTSNNRNSATLLMTILIALLGAFMMTLTSSPLVKGAALLWIPAALQLVAGVWLGYIRGFLAGGIGAYLAGIIAYGGWGLPDIIMNLIAGGFANSVLPAFLFSTLKINPDLDSNPETMTKGFIRVLVLTAIAIGLGFVSLNQEWGWKGYLPSIIIVFALPFLLNDLKLNKKQFIMACIVCVVISFISAGIGFSGMRLGGQTQEAALISATGWFLGDVISAFLGLYILASFTKKAIARKVYLPKTN